MTVVVGDSNEGVGRSERVVIYIYILKSGVFFLNGDLTTSETDRTIITTVGLTRRESGMGV